jgi:predicted nucleic acid-binding protein
MIYFGDTFYFLARLNPDDPAHSRAIALPSSSSDRLLTSEWVMMEVADALCNARHRGLVSVLYKYLQTTRNVQIIEATHPLFLAGLDLYVRRPDKDWSLTDCTSFIIMQDHNITDALTADHHFEQAGFVALLK